MSLNKVNYVHGQTIISAQNMNDIQDEIIRLGEKEVVQSDWLEQDENSLAYIKNKPFGVAGQYQVLCTAEEVALSNDLIQVTSDNDYNDFQNNGSNIYYLYKITSGLFFDFYGIGLDQKIAFESEGFYATLYDMRNSGGYTVPFSNYFNNPNITGTIQFISDIYEAPSHGVITISESTDSTIKTGLYLCLTNEKKCPFCDRVLLNSSYMFLIPGSLSTIDMPLGVNKALRVLDGLSPKTPLLPMLESANESLNNLSDALDNKVDKVNGKVLSDVNFTKEYESQVQSIDMIKRDMSDVRMRCSDLEDIIFSGGAAITRATEIAVNPYGASLNTQNLAEEMLKLNSGLGSDKIFANFIDEGLLFIKISDKLPTMEDISKGCTVILSIMTPSYDVPSFFPSFSPIQYLQVGDSNTDSDGWQFIQENLQTADGMQIFLDGLLIFIESSDNEFGLPEGIYSTIFLGEGSPVMLCSGLQINGFNLNSSTAPVSQEQLGDISSILDSIIGEQVWTFTLEDGSTVDKVVISSD